MFKYLNPLIYFILALIFFAVASMGRAETGNQKTLSPYFFIENGDPSVDRFPLKKTHVNVTITGVIADVVVTQKYANHGTRPITARYIFPASTRAAIHGMKMKIGEHMICAKVKERNIAQKEFNTAKKQGKSASLLKQQRPNVFSMNVANIMPKDIIEIELHYTELLVPTDGTYEFIYPTVVGPRYSKQSEADSAETDNWVKNPYLRESDEDRTEFDMDLTISTGIALQELVCPSHKTEILWENKSVARILMATSEKSGGNRDFIVNYRLAGKTIESGLMLYSGEDENFFLLMVQPPKRVKPADIPPREYIFVVDISGSMNGFPLNTAKKLLKNLIENLKESDKFNVVLFAGGSRVMAPASVPASGKNIHRATRLIDGQKGGGGTELSLALKKALSLPADEAYSRTILIITDGYIAAEKDVFHLIQQNLNRTNVFSFGIGSSVNRYLIEGMARAGHGEPFVVTQPREAHGAAQRFRNYVQSPVLTHIAVTYDGFETYDMEPPVIPDLFAQRPVMVFGKWRGNPQGTIELTGVGGSGDYLRTVNVSKIKPLEVNSALRYLWARTRIGRLSDFNFKDDTHAQITSLGLTYNLLTANTSFVAVHEVVRNPEAQSQDVHQPLPLPLHVSNLAVGGAVSKVPEPGLCTMIVIALMILILALGHKKYLCSRV
ncbi:MAG: Ca-activated chloride channel-like protein [Desulfobacteraceae bacterium Eth-SRB2]|nr:MAG: Ca-activated chloride channel-like protein [Desulfobacteraceae bacterium Eth-SRB2]